MELFLVAGGWERGLSLCVVLDRFILSALEEGHAA